MANEGIASLQDSTSMPCPKTSFLLWLFLKRGMFGFSHAMCALPLKQTGELIMSRILLLLVVVNLSGCAHLGDILLGKTDLLTLAGDPGRERKVQSYLESGDIAGAEQYAAQQYSEISREKLYRIINAHKADLSLQKRAAAARRTAAARNNRPPAQPVTNRSRTAPESSRPVAQPDITPTGVFALCKTDQVSRFSADEGCHQYYRKGSDQLCSDPAGKICSSTSREDLCIKTGRATGIPFTLWSSGWGTFDDLQSCLRACGRDSVVNFGGTCHGLVIK